MTISINGIPLPPEAIEFEYRRLLQFYSEHLSPEQLKEQRDVLMQRAKEQAIGAKLLIDEAHRLDLDVPPDMVDKEIRRMIHQSGGEAAFKVGLTDKGIDEEQLRKSIEESCKVNVLIERLCEGLSDPTEDEIKAHFDAHTDEYRRPERAAAQHILVKPDSKSVADQEVARSKLHEIRTQLEDGSDFADLASAHSECPSGKQTGGSLGWFGRGMMVPEFDAVVFALDVGELSDIVETEFGFHLIHRTGEDEGGEASLSEAADKVREFLRHVKRGEAVSARVNELREKAVIEDDGK